MWSSQLEQIADALEADAGITTAANDTETGMWLRAALAAEDLAGVATAANAGILGYMLRTAKALELLAGTTGAEENVSYEGYLKRIVDAFEDLAGAVQPGSLEHRAVLGSLAAIYNVLTNYRLGIKFITPEYWISGTQYAPITTLPGYSFTRTGEQGAVDASGAVQFFAANVPAINSAGYHAYGALTNYMLRSQEFDNAAWTKAASGAGVAPTVTANAATAPDGTLTAERVQFNKTGNAATDGSYLLQSYAPAGTCTGSVFMRSRTGSSQTVTFIMESGGTSNAVGVTVAVGTTWTRVVKSAPLIGVSFALYFGCFGNGWAPGVPNGSDTTLDLDVWQGEMIDGTYPDGGPLITTAGSTLGIGASDLRVNDTVGADAGQLFMASGNFANGGAAGVKRLVYWFDGTTNNIISLYKDGASITVVIQVGGVEVYRASAADPTGNITVVFRRSGGNWRAGYVKAGVLTWLGADTAAGWPSGMTVAMIASYLGTNQPENPVRFVGRKLGTFTTDAEVLAAVAETA